MRLIKQRILCPMCRSPIRVAKVPGPELKCPQCGYTFDVKSVKVQCPYCNKTVEIIVPTDMRVDEVFLMGSICPKNCTEAEKKCREKKWGKYYFLKCPERSLLSMYTVEVKCNKCGLILHIDLAEGEHNVKIAKFHPYFKYCIKFSEWLACRSLFMFKYTCHSLLNYYSVKRIGEAISILVFPLLYILLKCLTFYLYTGTINLMTFTFTLVITILSTFCFYYCFYMLSELDYIVGGIELKCSLALKNKINNSLSFFLGRKILLISYFVIIIIMFSDDYYYFEFEKEKAVLLLFDDITGLPFFLVMAMSFQVFFTLGVLLYILWANYRRGFGDIKGNFIDIARLVDRLSLVCIYTVIVLIGLYFASSLIFSISHSYEEISKLYFELFLRKEPLLGIFWDFFRIIVFIFLPASLYFSLLGGFTRSLKHHELRRIGKELLRAKSDEERKLLMSYMAEVRTSLRLPSIIDYLSRIAISVYLSFLLAKLVAP